MNRYQCFPRIIVDLVDLTRCRPALFRDAPARVSPPKRRRVLLEIDKATRLCYVMMLVGTGCDAPLASRAIAAMLVDHWCDKGPCAFLQKVSKGWK